MGGLISYGETYLPYAVGDGKEHTLNLTEAEVF